ncbi:MAG: restriction endonuclease subunit S [Alphaproteobacteria bacterium]|nr:restriction endonuclease subunit S [Alphaproteobacteria bacterium]
MSEISTLPDGWHRLTVGDLGTFINGMAFKPKDWESSGKPIIRIQNLSGSGNEFNYTSKPVKKKYVVLPGTLLVSWSATLDVYVWNGPEAVLNQHIFKVLPNTELIDKRFMYWLMKQAIDNMKRSAHLHGSTMKHINRGPFLAHRIDIPPLNEQRRIVAKLDALQAHLDAARAALDAVPTLLERYRQSVLAAAFRGDLTREWRAQNPDVEPATELLARIRVERRARWIADYTETQTRRAQQREEKKGKAWTEADEAKARRQYRRKAEGLYEEPEPVDAEKEGLPELPEGWCWVRFDDIGPIQLGRRRAPEYRGLSIEREYLRVANVKSDFIDVSDLNSMYWSPEDLVQFELQLGDILISEGQSLERIGQSALVDEMSVGFLYQSTLNRLRVFQPYILPRFAQLVCLAWTANGQFRSAASITTNIAHLTLSKLKQVPFPLAPVDEQTQISQRVDRLIAANEDRKSGCESMMEHLNRLQQSLLAKAFRGELVPQDPNDEPASALLARIQAERAGKKKTG